MGRPSVISTASRYQYQHQYQSPPENGRDSRTWRGPRRVLGFCLLAVILPCVLVSVALLMRFVVYGNAIYHLSPSDMRILDHRISTVWCQSERVKGNTSFTAYLTNGEPEVSLANQPLIIQRNLIVPDDHKEYWGFYLLQGSTFRIYTCARHKGGTLLIVRGRSHLEHCAYIGEADSAGNSDEFSSSNSNEAEAQSKKPTTVLSHSNEEMGVILTKIRQYIRSRPKNYGELKKNLADWMLIDQNKSSEHPPMATEENQNSNNKTSSSREITDSEHLKASTSGEAGLVEHGTIRRHRRQTEVRKASDSGENGAFEEESGEKETSLSSTDSPMVKDGESSSMVNAIWKLEHNHHVGVLNDTVDPNGVDGSNSESESSWSSSEEAMAKCEGVVASLLLKANDTCGLELDGDLGEPFFESLVNVSGYYYFIFGSENEKRDNIIKARFELEKYVYDLGEPVENCTDVKDCQVSFEFASSQKLVVTVPLPPPHLEANWNENYVAESECLPRTSLYLMFVITVPLVILLCAFQ